MGGREGNSKTRFLKLNKIISHKEFFTKDLHVFSFIECLLEICIVPYTFFKKRHKFSTVIFYIIFIRYNEIFVLGKK